LTPPTLILMILVKISIQFKIFCQEKNKAIAIYEFDQSKVSEVMEVIASRDTKYYGVPGFTYSLPIWLELKEALKAMGMG
jgi:hypothetical protein